MTKPNDVKYSITKMVFFLLFKPTRFDEIDKELIAQTSKHNELSNIQKSQVLRKALFNSFLLIVIAALVGMAIAFASSCINFCITSRTNAYVQIVGSMVLLWGTLFVRGYELETWKSNTYAEQINQVIYRGMYCFGTSIMVYSLFNTQCS